MSILYDASGSQTEVAFGTPVTWSHTCTGTDLILLVWVAPSSSNSPVVTGVTYNGTALTSQYTVGAGTKSNGSLWYLINPATGAHTVSVALSPTSQFLSATSGSYTGVHQVTPFGTGAGASGGATGGATTTAQVAVTSAAGELITWFLGQDFFDSGFAYQGTAAATASSLTERVQIRNPNAGGQATRSAIGDAAGAASVTAGWSISKDVFWDIYGIPLKPSGAAASSWGLLLSDQLNRIVP